KATAGNAVLEEVKGGGRQDGGLHAIDADGNRPDQRRGKGGQLAGVRKRRKGRIAHSTPPAVASTGISRAESRSALCQTTVAQSEIPSSQPGSIDSRCSRPRATISRFAPMGSPGCMA